MILEFVFEVDIIWTHFLHILDNVNGNHSFTLFPFYLINIFITKLLEKAAARLLFHCIKEDVDISFWYENHINKAVVFYGNRV